MPPWVPVLELALYAPGFTTAPARPKFGDAGDFVTAPELSPLFAACVADALAPVLQQLGPEAACWRSAAAVAPSPRPASCQAAGRRCPAGPLRDPRAQRRPAGTPARAPAAAPAALLFELVEWLDGPIQDPGAACCSRTRCWTRSPPALRDPRWRGGGGACRAGWRRPLPARRPVGGSAAAAAVRHVERQLPQPFAEGYRSELLAQLPYWLQAVVGGMGDGALLFVDYGHPRAEYYQPQRRDGTLRAFRRHHLVGGRAGAARPAGHHRLGGLHRPGRSGHWRRVRVHRLLPPGEPADRQPPAGEPRAGRGARAADDIAPQPAPAANC